MPEQSSLSLNVEPYKRIRIATIAGVEELTDANADALQEALLEYAMKQSHMHLLVDLKNVTYMTSAALRVFITVRQTLAERGGSMRITGATDNIRRVFEVTNLHTVFHTDQTSATAADQYVDWVERGGR